MSALDTSVAAAMAAATLQTFAAGDVVLQSGATLPGCEVVYATYGRLNEHRDNVIVFPTRIAGSHVDNAYLIGPGRALDPDRWFIVVPNMLGNGVSSSPSNTPAPLDGPRFPTTTHVDNVHLQRRLLVERFGVDRVALVVGWSMGGQQAYHWGALYPDAVQRIAVLCGAARTARHTHVFLEGMRAALTADAAFAGGDYTTPPLRGLRAMGRAWAGWALSQAFYRHEGYRGLGYSSLEDFLVRYWEGMFLGRDANNLLAMIATWQAADVGANPRYGGDYEAAMAAITVPALVMPGRTDLYFPPEDSAAEVELLARGRLVVIPSDWGHYAGGAKNPADVDFVDAHLRELLEAEAS
ncbi:MAG: homoserine O-acetyltransferase/O-succinyltransferase [Solirubrobacteraceae bacterium]|nr:homoserine O-acetyltransferase/O-succinyltransferase [Solirubrobacteraceae bacterium]